MSIRDRDNDDEIKCYEDEDSPRVMQNSIRKKKKNTRHIERLQQNLIEEQEEKDHDGFFNDHFTQNDQSEKQRSKSYYSKGIHSNRLVTQNINVGNSANLEQGNQNVYSSKDFIKHDHHYQQLNRHDGQHHFSLKNSVENLE